jgi:hypothetical protein
MRILLILSCLFFSVEVFAQRIQAGNMSFEFNGQKMHLNLSAADLNKTNLISCKLRGEKTGDTLIMGTLGFAMKKLAAGADVVAMPSFEMALMHSFVKQNKSYQFSTSPDGKTATLIEKNRDQTDSHAYGTVNQTVSIKKVELKEGILHISGTFTAEYESPKGSPMMRKINITNGSFQIAL